jgi:hypothetical protein
LKSPLAWTKRVVVAILTLTLLGLIFFFFYDEERGRKEKKVASEHGQKKHC